MQFGDKPTLRITQNYKAKKWQNASRKFNVVVFSGQLEICVKRKMSSVPIP